MFGGSFINPLLLKKTSVKKIAIFGLAFASIFILASSLMHSFWQFSWVYFISAIGSAFALSNLMNLCSMAAPVAIQGKVMGLSQSMMSLGWFLVPIFAAWMGNYDISLFYPIAAMFLFIACLMLIFKKRKSLGA